MYAKQTILAKLDELLQYSITQIPTLDYEEKETFGSYYTSIVSGGKSSVTAYFSVDRSKFKKPLDDLGLYLHNGIWERAAKWENEFEMGFRTDFPEYYNDLRKMFYQFDWFMGLTNEEFFNAWVYSSPESDDPTAPPEPPVPSSNSYISRLNSDLILVATESETGEVVSKPIIQQEMENIEALGSWLETSSGDYSPVMLWEDTGELLEAPETRPIAYKVFLDRGLREAIYTLNLPAYVPTYLRSNTDQFYGTFPSVLAMKASTDVSTGLYVVISSNDEDNGNLYLKTEKEYTFIANICGEKGDRGVTFTPHYDSDTGYLSWTNDGGLTNPPPMYIKGDAGEVGNIAFFTIKGKVNSMSDLPSNPTIDDMYCIVDGGYCVVWNGIEWENYGNMIQIRG